MMKTRIFAGVLLIGILAILQPGRAYAQAVANAQIRGVITDATGAVVPDAEIRAIQTDTDRTRTTTSGTDGSYVLPNLPVGPYRLEVSKPSFTTFVRSGIILQVGNNVQINCVLQVGAVTQEVQVSANAAMVETQDTAVSQVIDNRRITALPLNGRQATDLILLSGAAAIAPNSTRYITTHDYPTAVAVSVAGGHGNTNTYLLDGADHRDTHSNVNLPYPFPDALQEFNVQTGGLSTRNGLQAGAVVNVVTKSGTNDLHGNAFEFVRNGKFNARDFFAAERDSLRRNQFGGTVGGPIKKDKLFFFAGYQGTRERTAASTRLAHVLTQDILNGDFSTLASAACQTSGTDLAIIDPDTGQPFPNNFIDPSRFSTPAVNLAEYVPITTDPCGEYRYAIPSPKNEEMFITREDWQQSDKHTIFGRYFYSDYSNPPIFDGKNILTTTRSGLLMRAQAAVLGSQWAASPTFINAFHLSYSRLAITRGVAPGIPGPASVGVNMFNLVPDYIDLSVSSHFSMGGGSNAPSIFVRNQWQLADDVDWIRGRHHVSFGGSVINVQMNERNVQRGNGTFAFNGSVTGEALADFLLGKPNSVIQQSLAEVGLRQKYVGLYVQDSMNVTRRLNAYVGLRWEPSLPEHDNAGRGQHFSMDAFEAGETTSVYNNAPPGLQWYGDPGIPKAYANARYLDFAPRFGLAWDPTGSGTMTVRAAYAVFFDTPEAFTARDWANASPWGNRIDLIQPAGGFDDPYADYPGGNPFPFPSPPSADSIFPSFATYTNFPLDLHHPYSQKWTLGVQRQWGENWLTSATYIGTKATHLRAGTEANPADPTVPGASRSNTNERRVLYLMDPVAGAFYSHINTLDDGLNSIYHGLKLSVEHRFSNNFTLLSSYTYSQCMQGGGDIGNRLVGNTYMNPYDRNADYGPCYFDLRHNFVTSFVAMTPRQTNRILNAVFADWQASFIVSRRSGFPFNPTSGIDASLTGVGLDRPDNVGGDPYIRNMTTRQWVNPASFVQNADGTFGNTGWNSLRGPGFVNLDTGLDRVIRITERHSVELRFEFFNILNHPNFNNPTTNLRSSTFGQLTSARDPRIIQFGLKYKF